MKNNKPEPKFKIGDKITWNTNNGEIIDYEIFPETPPDYKSPIFYKIKCTTGFHYTVSEDIISGLKQNESKFEIGDIVEFGGIEGVIVSIDDDMSYPLSVNFEEDYWYFLADGRLNELHTKPLLNLVRKGSIVRQEEPNDFIDEIRSIMDDTMSFCSHLNIKNTPGFNSMTVYRDCADCGAKLDK